MRKSEKESFLKSFVLFFMTLILLNGIIFFLYFQEQKHALNSEIFNKIKIYNYDFKDKDIKINISPLQKNKKLFLLNIDKKEIFAYFNIPNSKTSSLKIVYPYKKYEERIEEIIEDSLFYFLITTLVLFFMSIFYSLYSIKPLKTSLDLLDEFLKDIIHDLNTPISSILLNLKILKTKKSDEAIKRIEFSTKSIGSLYRNLEIMIKDAPLTKSKIDIISLIDEKIEYYTYIYPHIDFNKQIKISTLKTSKNEFSRILDNLISNACKYNKQNGKVGIYIDEYKLVIKDSGIGIKDTKKVFDRFYKETDRGIGLGLDIVKKICKRLNYKISISSKIDIGTSIEVTLK